MDDEAARVIGEVPEVLRPAVTAVAEADVGAPASFADRASVATAVLRAAVAAGVIVARASYDDLDAELRQALGRLERVDLQIADVGMRRARAEQMCHTLAEALETGVGREEAMVAYRELQW